MRAVIASVVIALATTACSRGDDSARTLAAVAPPAAAPERSSMPEECKVALTFNQGCVDLFDRAFGTGVGAAERMRLQLAYAHSGWGKKPSTAKPAPALGLKTPNKDTTHGSE